MIPERVDFTGLTIEPVKLLLRNGEKRAIPNKWGRVRFIVTTRSDLHKMDKWLAANIQNDWISYITEVHRKLWITIAFENIGEAVMFRLMGGEDILKEINLDKDV